MKLTPTQRQTLLDLAADLVDPAVEDSIVIHEVESPFEEDDGVSSVIISCKGDYRRLIECRKSILRDVIRTLKIAFEENL